ncbi:MAG: hypothetical protein ACI4QT_01855 [Kiritimatiellia bacterium]
MARIDWNIHARSASCIRCGTPFETGAPVRSAVLPFEHPLVSELLAQKLAEEQKSKQEGVAVKPHPDYIRLDFCESCWKQLPKTEWMSVWKAVFPEPPEKNDPANPLKKETMESLLRSLLEGDDAENHCTAIYLLALQLERKRILVERAVRHTDDGVTIHFYEHRRSGDILLIRDPHLTDAQIPETQAEIERLLNGANA